MEVRIKWASQSPPCKRGNENPIAHGILPTCSLVWKFLAEGEPFFLEKEESEPAGRSSFLAWSQRGCQCKVKNMWSGEGEDAASIKSSSPAPALWGWGLNVDFLDFSLFH